MKERQARKIIKNVMIYPCMHYVYGMARVDKANSICIRRYARTDQAIKRWNILCNKDPLSALKVLTKNN